MIYIKDDQIKQLNKIIDFFKFNNKNLNKAQYYKILSAGDGDALEDIAEELTKQEAEESSATLLIYKNDELINEMHPTNAGAVKQILYRFTTNQDIKILDMLDNKASYLYKFTGAHGEKWQYIYKNIEL